MSGSLYSSFTSETHSQPMDCKPTSWAQKEKILELSNSNLKSFNAYTFVFLVGFYLPPGCCFFSLVQIVSSYLLTSHISTPCLLIYFFSFSFLIISLLYSFLINSYFLHVFCYSMFHLFSYIPYISIWFMWKICKKDVLLLFVHIQKKTHFCFSLSWTVSMICHCLKRTVCYLVLCE